MAEQRQPRGAESILVEQLQERGWRLLDGRTIVSPDGVGKIHLSRDHLGGQVEEDLIDPLDGNGLIIVVDESRTDRIKKLISRLWYLIKLSATEKWGVLRLKGRLLPDPFYNLTGPEGWKNLYWSRPNSLQGSVKRYWKEAARGLLWTLIFWIPIRVRWVLYKKSKKKESWR